MRNFTNKRFETLRKVGKRIFINPITFISHSSDYPLLIVSVPKRVGCACVRNKIRRRIQNIFRKSSEKLSCWCVVKKSENGYNYETLKKCIEKFESKI